MQSLTDSLLFVNKIWSIIFTLPHLPPPSPRCSTRCEIAAYLRHCCETDKQRHRYTLLHEWPDPTP